MGNQLLLNSLLVSVLTFLSSFTALDSFEDKKNNVIKDPYKYVLQDLRVYIVIYFNEVDEIKIVKKR